MLCDSECGRRPFGGFLVSIGSLNIIILYNMIQYPESGSQYLYIYIIYQTAYSTAAPGVRCTLPRD